MSTLRSKFNITFTQILITAFRFIQFVLALTVCGLYGVDLNNARKQKKYVDSKWLYAEIIGALAAFVSLIYMIPTKTVMDIPFAFAIDAVLFVLWLAVFGVFGELYIGTHAQGDAGQIRMHHAVWVDLTNTLLWLISAGFMTVYWMRNRHNRTRFTGRANV